MKIYASEHYLLIGLNVFLFFLVLLNIWQILVKQRRYKTLPLLFFYIFAFIAIALRLIYHIFSWSENPIFTNVNYIYIAAKLCVGLLQTWMIFEIAMRIRHMVASQKHVEGSAASFERWMRTGQYSIISTSSLGFVAFVAFVSTKVQKGDHMQNYDQLDTFIGYSYLTLFILMASVNIFLLVQIRAKNQSQIGGSNHQEQFRREKFNLSVILIFFELSYLLRFVWDVFIADVYDSDVFYYELGYDTMAYAEGLAFMALLLQHNRNFKQIEAVPEALRTGSH